MSKVNFNNGDEESVNQSQAQDAGKSLTERLQGWFGIGELAARRIQLIAGITMLLVSFYFWFQVL